MEISDDRLRYTFYLRQDVFFHDNDAFEGGKGRRMTAYDVEYSFNRIIDKNTASSGAWIFNTRVDPVHPFRAVNDSVFEVNLIRPFTPLPGCFLCNTVPLYPVKLLRNSERISGAILRYWTFYIQIVGRRPVSYPYKK
jgi:peptide/nickel transport system substrate-binding protein